MHLKKTEFDIIN